ncbi:MAG: glutamate--tRNA ligase [Gammaproteobacteria bacterium]|nr:glutamate--tRNA ligase [Gammaproteobacteria bacterium]
MTVKTRFAPSPTGFLHLGGVRTALFCWLFARRHDGAFLLRIEDTDRERSTQDSIDAILTGMTWVGLTWDEGPYYQTQRYDRYREVAAELQATGHAYHCYCSPQELEDMRAQQVAAGQNPKYDGRCRNRRDIPAGVQPVLRFRTPQAGKIVVDDLVRGRVVIENRELDDLVIVRADGNPTYHFSVVVDDHDMDITHVIRGDDHLKNTPRQINMIKALGWTRPEYAHLPMILGEDGSRLSKRHGAVNVLDYRDQGYLPAAVLNYLVRLGWSHGDQELFSQEEMIELFDLADVNASASRFDSAKLSWLNQQHIMRTPVDELVPLLQEQLAIEGLDPDGGPALEIVIEAYRERATTMQELAQSCWYLFRDFDDFDPTAAKKHLRPVVGEALADLRDRLALLQRWTAAEVHDAIDGAATNAELSFGKLGQPLRVALTGGSVSPPIDTTAALVGRERGLVRLDLALAFIARRQAAAG